MIHLDNFRLSQTKELVIGDTVIEPNILNTVKIYAGKLPSDTRISVYAHVMHSVNPGPSLLVLGGVHGNEINGIEIVRRSIEEKLYNGLHCGTVIVIPLLNIYGFINFSRSVPDGKDVNRSFPGHINGSLASRVARIITKNILPYIDVAIDFHTGGDARFNYPQIRYAKSDLTAQSMANVFNTRYLIEQPLIPNSFRKSAKEQNVPAIVFEGGESIRLDTRTIQTGTDGIRRLLIELGLVEGVPEPELAERFVIHRTSWIRAASSGLFIWHRKSGEFVTKGDLLGEIKDPFGTKSLSVLAKTNGHIIGHNNACVVSLGDALFHIGQDFSVYR